MNAKKAFLFGALVGVAIALLFVFLDWLRPFPVDVNAVDRTTFRLCPLYGLGFSDFVRSGLPLNALTAAGNAVLYGIAGTLLFLLLRLTRVSRPSRS